MAVKKIASDTLDFILESCKSSHPHEFGALLEAEGDTITHVIYLPGTEATSQSVLINKWMMPNVPHAGSVHSHPSGAVYPSGPDLIFFRSNQVNIIVGSPYSRDSWKAFDHNGELVQLEVMECELEEDTALDRFRDELTADLGDEFDGEIDDGLTHALTDEFTGDFNDEFEDDFNSDNESE
jgi:Predicted metal-dependent protease of the PAD1/JAB1 superfamily